MPSLSPVVRLVFWRPEVLGVQSYKYSRKRENPWLFSRPGLTRFWSPISSADGEHRGQRIVLGEVEDAPINTSPGPSNAPAVLIRTHLLLPTSSSSFPFPSTSSLARRDLSNDNACPGLCTYRSLVTSSLCPRRPLRPISMSVFLNPMLRSLPTRSPRTS